MYARSKSEVDNFFTNHEKLLENVFKDESLAQPNVWG